MKELNVYEEQNINKDENLEGTELIPVEAEPEEETGMSTGAIVLVTSLATAGGIWLVNKAVKLVKGIRAKKATQEAAGEEAPEESNEEAAPENAEA